MTTANEATAVAAVAMPEPMIYSILAWTKNPDGTFKLNTHMVAGFDSVDAANRFLSSSAPHLRGYCFINTDRFMADYGSAARMFTTRFTNEDNVTLANYRAWIKRATNDNHEDGETYPAPFRHMGNY